MATPDDYALARVAERVEQLTREIDHIPKVSIAPASTNESVAAALGAIGVTLEAHTRAVQALLEIAATLATEIDRLKHT